MAGVVSHTRLQPVLAAFIRRDFATDISYRTVFATQILTTVFTLALFFYLSKVVDDAEFAAGQGLESGYFGFVAVGLGLFTIIQTSLISFSAKLREEQTSGTFEALMTTPASPSLLILSSAAYDLLRALISGLLLVTLALTVFGLDLDTDAGRIAIAFGTLAASMVLFAAVGVFFAALVVIFKRAAGLTGIFITVLALLGGVYFPIDVLPGPIEALGQILPFTWALDVTRGALLGGEIESAKIAGLIVSSALLLPLALLAFRASVNRARRTGSLAEY